MTSLEQGGQFGLFRLGIPVQATRSAVAKDEIIAEVAPLLFQDPFRLGFPAIIVGSRCQEAAIETAAEVRSAEGAGILPASRGFDFQIFLTAMTFFHLIACPRG